MSKQEIKKPIQQVADINQLKVSPVCKRLLEKERQKIRKLERKKIKEDEQD